MDEKNVSAEELATEKEALQERKEDEIRANIISEFGFDETADSEKIDKLVSKEVEHSKKLSSAIGQKIKWRTEAGKRTPVSDKNDVQPEKKPEAKSGEFDLGERAFLRSYDIKGADELALAKQWRTRTGDTIDVMVEDEIFLAKLKNLREKRETQEAVPPGSKRVNAGNKNTLDVALEKYKTTGELPEDRDLREKVVDAAVTEKRDGRMFYNS